MTPFNIPKAFEDKAKRGWKKLYWAIDLHDTIIPGTYSKFNEGRELYPHALEVLRLLTGREDMCLILYTSSHHESVQDIMKWLNAQNIWFDYVNENPECPSTDLCDFDAKLYFNILLDDKAGFYGPTDWLLVKETLQNIGEWVP